jgi:hypothetical protein
MAHVVTGRWAVASVCRPVDRCFGVVLGGLWTALDLGGWREGARSRDKPVRFSLGQQAKAAQELAERERHDIAAAVLGVIL